MVEGTLARLTQGILLIPPLLLQLGCATPAGPATTGDAEHIASDGILPLVYRGPLRDDPTVFRVDVAEKPLFVLGDAVRPSVHSVYLLEHLRFEPGDTVLDLGTGCGIQSLFAAWSGKAQKIVATDLGEDAVRSARYNVQYHHLAEQIDVRQGDLFAPLRQGETFSLIINSIDFPEDPKAVDHPLWRVHERFFAQVGQFLQPKGRIVYQGGHVENIARLWELARANGLVISDIHMHYNPFIDKVLINYLIEHDSLPRVSR